MEFKKSSNFTVLETLETEYNGMKWNIILTKEIDQRGYETFDYYLQRQGCGIIDFVWGVFTENETYESFYEMVTNPYTFGEDVEIYLKQFCEE